VHRALVVQVPAAATGRSNGAALRVLDVVKTLRAGGFEPTIMTAAAARRDAGHWCLGVAVSYASSGSVRMLRSKAPLVWLDAMDSWLLVDGSGLRRGHASYAARALRDGARLLRLSRPDLLTYISNADLIADRRSVRGRQRLVLPGVAHSPSPLEGEGETRRVVLVGDWGYPPNKDGLRWFRRHVMPHLGALTAEVVVYGAGTADESRDGVMVRGYVPDDTELYRPGDVHVAPVRFGGGVKRKVLQPLLAGLPVVTTPAGAHGLRANNLLDVHADPKSFASAIRTRLDAAPTHARPAPADLLDADDTAAVLRWLSSAGMSCRHS
jgi:hypothetical protein